MVNNYYKFRDRRPWCAKYAFLDTPERFHKRLAKKYGIKMRGIREMVKAETDVRLIVCRIRKSDNSRFVEMLNEIRRNAMVCGHRDYECYCQLLQDVIENA